MEIKIPLKRIHIVVGIFLLLDILAISLFIKHGGDGTARWWAMLFYLIGFHVVGGLIAKWIQYFDYYGSTKLKLNEVSRYLWFFIPDYVHGGTVKISWKKDDD